MSGVKNIITNKSNQKVSKNKINNTNTENTSDSDDYDLNKIDFKNIISNCQPKNKG